VYEYNASPGMHIMRRRVDDWINATHILKAAGFDKPARTRILEREVQKGVHEKVQGGYGKYQGRLASTCQASPGANSQALGYLCRMDGYWQNEMESWTNYFPYLTTWRVTAARLLHRSMRPRLRTSKSSLGRVFRRRLRAVWTHSFSTL
jgi:KilA-N domain